MSAGDQEPRIVVAWDGSRASAATFTQAGIIGAQLGVAVVVLKVVSATMDRGDFARAVRDVALGGLENARLRIETGEPAQAIVRVAGEPGVVLLILSTHGGDIQEGPRLGGVAKAVLIGSGVPVLLVRPEASPYPRELRQLLVPLDGTPKTAAALQPATALAQQLGASLDLLYVAGPGSAPEERGSIAAPRYVDQQQHEWPHWATEVADRMAVYCAQCPPEVAIQVYLATGDISREIERFAVEHATDAIVLVRRSRLQRNRAHALRAMIDRAPCPIVICGGPERP